MNMKASVFLVCVAALNVAAGTASPTTIKGKIMNMEEVKKYLAEDTYLQLVHPGKGGGLAVKSDGRGRLTYESNLAQVKMPKSGEFSISASGLEPGTYLIAGQKVEPFPGQILTLLFRKGERKALEIKVPEDTKGPSLDVGEVYFRVPGSKHF